MQIGVGDGGAHLFTAVPVHHVDGVGIESARPANNMAQQRAPGERLQDLGQI